MLSVIHLLSAMLLRSGEHFLVKLKHTNQLTDTTP